MLWQVEMASFSTILKQPGCLSKLVTVRSQGRSTEFGTHVTVPTMLGGHLGCKLISTPQQQTPSKRSLIVRAVSTSPQQQSNSPTLQRAKEALKQRTFISEDLASRWRDVHGATDWKDMLDPLDADVRAELIRYGEFVQATYDTFDADEYSKYRGSCRYSKDHFFDNIGLIDTGYEVTKYLYSTTDVESLLLINDQEDAWSRGSNWAGYVAVCTDPERIKQLGRRDIVVAWRGTIMQLEWAANLKTDVVPSSLDDRDKSDGVLNPKVGIQRGFLSLYTTTNPKTEYNHMSAREQLLRELSRLIKKYDDETLSITISGHSLGAALAVISAYDIAESGINRHFANAPIPKAWNQQTVPTPTSDPGKTRAVNAIPLTVFSFAGPRVGNTAFVNRITQLGVKVLRVVNVNDLVPKVPGLLFNEQFKLFNDAVEKLPWTYSHCGVEIEVNNEHSPYLKPRPGVANVHNFEGYLHLIAGYVGKGKGIGKDFKLQLKRDIALVNKSSDLLKPQKHIPSCWWQQANKGLVLNDDFDWVQSERDTEDIPAPE